MNFQKLQAETENHQAFQMATDLDSPHYILTVQEQEVPEHRDENQPYKWMYHVSEPSDLDPTEFSISDENVRKITFDKVEHSDEEDVRWDVVEAHTFDSIGAFVNHLSEQEGDTE